MPSSRVVGSAAGAVVGYERHHTTRACSADDASIRAWAERHLSDSWPYRASLLVLTAQARRIVSASAWAYAPRADKPVGWPGSSAGRRPHPWPSRVQAIRTSPIPRQVRRCSFWSLYRLPNCRFVTRVHAWLPAMMVCTVTATTSQTRMPNCRSIRMRMRCDRDLCIGGRPRCSGCSAAVCWGLHCVSQGKFFYRLKAQDGRGRRS